ncbi:MAG: hypothetical protein RIC11_19115 [Botrimarina sp.]
MAFIEMTGKTLDKLLVEDELHHDDLRAAGVDDRTIVRVNREGDIEVRRPEGWEVIGGLLGEFEERIRRETGLDWA